MISGSHADDGYFPYGNLIVRWENALRHDLSRWHGESTAVAAWMRRTLIFAWSRSLPARWRERAPIVLAVILTVPTLQPA